MRDLQRGGRLAAALVVAMAVGVSACGSASSGPHVGHGTVESVDAEARKVTLDHGDIPGLMKAMTMTFDVAPGVALEGIDRGTEVDFEVEYAGGIYTVTRLRRSDP